eukprot:COSAG01_NODE_10745_length_2090_cov_2.940231_2_plen_203_part_00
MTCADRELSPLFELRAEDIPGLQAGHMCVECPPCVTCPGGTAPPTINAGYSMSPVSLRLWNNGLQSNTSNYVTIPDLSLKALSDLPSGSHGLFSMVPDFRQQASERARSCAKRHCESLAHAQSYADGYCDFDESNPPGQHRCISALHSRMLNISLFKCPFFSREQSPNSSCAGPTEHHPSSSSSNTALVATTSVRANNSHAL